MAATVVAHLAISIVHGAAHTGAHVPLSLVASLFVFAVIVAGPVVGVALSWRAAQLGTLIVAVTMAGSLIFGLVNHFVLESPDHVSHVQAPWRLLFGTTAVLLSITELLALGLAVRLLRPRRICSPGLNGA